MTLFRLAEYRGRRDLPRLTLERIGVGDRKLLLLLSQAAAERETRLEGGGGERRKKEKRNKLFRTETKNFSKSSRSIKTFRGRFSSSLNCPRFKAHLFPAPALPRMPAASAWPSSVAKSVPLAWRPE